MVGRRSIDRDGFVKGMWRIDEELRKAHNAQRASNSAGPSTSKQQ